MEITIKLLVVSINWMDGNFYVAVKDGKIPSRPYNPPQQPVEIGLGMAEEIVSLSKQWMNCKIVNSYIKEEHRSNILQLIYKTVIPHDPNIELKNGYKWANIKLLDTDETELINSVEEAVRGIS